MRLNRRFRFDRGADGHARKTVAGYVERMNQLYERGAAAVRIGQYVRRWQQMGEGASRTIPGDKPSGAVEPRDDSTGRTDYST